jgi:hypothetical protein
VLRIASNGDGSGRMIGRLMTLSIAIYVSCEVGLGDADDKPMRKIHSQIPSVPNKLVTF